MNMPRRVKFILLTSVLLSIIACKGHQYQNNASLEQPPSLEIERTINSPAVTETNMKTGLDHMVGLVGTRLNLKQPYEQAWETLAAALEFSRIKISDRNQEMGVYFINYDADNTNNKNTGILDNLSTFLFKDDYARATYKITVVRVSQVVEITAEKVMVTEMSLLDGNEDIIFDDKVDDGAEKLIHHLHEILKNDLPLD